jgi:hypothetical protein
MAELTLGRPLYLYGYPGASARRCKVQMAQVMGDRARLVLYQRATSVGP